MTRHLLLQYSFLVVVVFLTTLGPGKMLSCDCSVRPDGWWHCGALLLVQGVVDDGPVLQGSLAVSLSPRHSVLPPVLFDRPGFLSLQWFTIVIFIITGLEVLPENVYVLM